MTARTIRIDDSRVVHDLNDGEVLAIRSDTGTYYSMLGPAADIWDAIASGADESTLATVLTSRYRVEHAVAAAAVTDFVDRLVDEGLVTSGVHAAPSPSATPQPAGKAELDWEPPALQVYTDMQDLLLFDPIHEVGPEGWPAVADDPR